MKYDMAYKRFRHFGMDKVKMDFAFFGIAFNLKKMCSKMAKSAKNKENRSKIAVFSFQVRLRTVRAKYFGEIRKKSCLKYIETSDIKKKRGCIKRLF